MAHPKLLTICGSLRKGSFNRKLLSNAVEAFGPADVVDADLNLPLFNEDLEEAEGIPAPVQTLADQLNAADGVIIACPEYNKGITGVLKNALDWISRTDGQKFNGKPTVILSANAGRTGGETGQFTVVHCLLPMHPHLVLGPMVLVAGAGDAFDEDGKLKADSYRKPLQTRMDALRAAIG
ncbi:MAG: NADPH-dependent FMN reductase [Pseudomonadota bacterium]